MINKDDFSEYIKFFDRYNLINLAKDINHLKIAHDNTLNYIIKNRKKIELYSKQDEFINNGWPFEKIYGTSKFPSEVSLMSILDDNDSLLEINKDYILIKKVSGVKQYYDRDPSESKAR